jgi:hypothetical protein
MRFADLPGTNLSQHWAYVFAPRQMVEERSRGMYTKTRFDLDPVEAWLIENYPEGTPFRRQWKVLGSMVAMNSEDIAFAFKLRWF